MPHVKMNNKPLTPKPAELTEERKKEQALRAFIQKRNAIAEALLINEARWMRITKANGREEIDTAPWWYNGMSAAPR